MGKKRPSALKRLLAERLKGLRLTAPKTTEADYDAVFDRLRRQARFLNETVTRNKKRVEDPRYTGLVDQPGERQETVLANSSPTMLLALAYALMRESFAQRFDDVRRSLALAKLAHRAAEAVARKFCLSPASASDLIGESLGHLGNALRLNSDLAGAERALADAETHLNAGTRDRELRADHLSFVSALRHAQGRLGAEATVLEREIALRRLLGDPKKLAAALLNRARPACIVGDDLLLASELVGEALELLEEGDHLLTFLGLLHLAEAFARNGDGIAAWKLLCTSDFVALVAGFGEGLQRRHRWVKGITHRALGETRYAASLLTAVRDGFVESGQPLLAAFVSLDLLAALAVEGDKHELVALADAAYRTFVAERLEQEALSAFLVLHRAARAEQLTEELAVKVANFVYRRQHDREVRFE